jgi:hypothetical protein
MWNLKTIFIITVLCILTIGAVFSVGLAGCSREDNKVNPAEDTRGSEVTIPAIDADKTMETVTATFALG